MKTLRADFLEMSVAIDRFTTQYAKGAAA